MARCRQCPYKKVCRDECYGENPCALATSYDRLSRKVKNLQLSVRSLKQERGRAVAYPPQHRVFGEYVMTPVPNAFNGKTSWWISRKDRILAHYCFTAASPKEADCMIESGLEEYKKLLEGALRNYGTEKR